MPDAVRVDVRQRLQVVVRRHHVVELLAAVVDRVVVRRAVPGAAAIVGRDDDVAALHRLLHERQHRLVPVAVHAAVHPDHRRVTACAALRQRREQVRRNVHVARATPVLHLAELHDATAAGGVDAVGPALAAMSRSKLRGG